MRAILRRGFTLLEVMVAVVILAVGLSSLFTSEAGAIRIAQRARTTTIATLLARCKMGEIEEKIAKEGWPAELVEEEDECCADGEHDGFSCEWKVERIKLPDIDESGDGGVGSSDDKDDKDKDDKSPLGGGGMIDKLAELSKEDPSERMNHVTDVLSGTGIAGAHGDELSGERKRNGEASEEGDEEEEPLDPMAQMVMELAFPVMKPVIEEGVRRATVHVLWKEGQKEQRLTVTQFLVTEQQIILPEDDDSDGGVPNTGTNTNATSPSNPGAIPAPGTNNPGTGR